MTTHIIPATGNGIQPRHETALTPIDTASTAAAVRAKAEVEARYVVAHGRPRSIDEARRRILEHCRRLSFAESARYSIPIAGQNIVGPTIRFVEAAMAEYGNVLISSSVVWDDERERRVEVSVTDLERNICYPKEIVIEKTVERKKLQSGQKALGSRLNAYGDLVYLVPATEAQMLAKQGALESKAIRTLGLRILPADIVDEAMRAISATMAGKGGEDPAVARRRLVDAFSELGVYPKAIEKYLGHPLEQMTPATRETLAIAYATVRDGEATWAELLEFKHGPPEPEGDGKADAKPKSRVAIVMERKKAQRSEAKAKEEAETTQLNRNKSTEVVDADPKKLKDAK